VVLLPIAIASIICGLYSQIILILVRYAHIPPMDGSATLDLPILSTYFELFYWASLTVDITIAAVMTKYLLASRLGFNPATDSIITRILTLSISNAFIVVLAQLAVVISIRATASSPSTVPQLFEEIVCLAFANSYLFSANARPASENVTGSHGSDSSGRHTSVRRHTSRNAPLIGSGVTVGSETIRKVDFRCLADNDSERFEMKSDRLATAV